MVAYNGALPHYYTTPQAHALHALHAQQAAAQYALYQQQMQQYPFYQEVCALHLSQLDRFFKFDGRYLTRGLALSNSSRV